MCVKWFKRACPQGEIVSGLVVQKRLEGHRYGASAHPVLQGVSVLPAQSRPCGGVNQA